MRRFVGAALCGVLAWGFPAGPAGAQDSLRLGLRETEERALKNSESLRAAERELAAARARERGQRAPLFPQVSLDGSFRYVSEVAAFRPAAGGPEVKLGDNENYSVGPTLSWLMWDSGGSRNRRRSASARRRAKENEAEAARRNVLLEARLDYFQVQLALEQVRLLADSLALAEAQYKDISLKQKAGAVSRLDALSAHQEVLSRQRQLRQAQTELSVALRTLLARTRPETPVDPSVTGPVDGLGRWPSLAETPTLLLGLEDLSVTRGRLEPAVAAAPDTEHPQRMALLQTAESARRAARALAGGGGPVLQFSARTSLDYPNGPKLETIHQNTVGLSARLPLFEAGKSKREAEEQNEQAAALEARRDEAAVELDRAWRQAHDQIKGLTAQLEIARRSVDETEELARLTYDSYTAGRSSFIEVQSANLRALEAKVVAARTEVQILMQLAIVDGLSRKG
ncbi:MAG TPA: TolC family protein [Elusimicrobiota bacterium]|nr:TolC family protein [Elusimicrobiota bacterium]